MALRLGQVELKAGDFFSFPLQYRLIQQYNGAPLSSHERRDLTAEAFSL
jgi:hypothetical protein